MRIARRWKRIGGDPGVWLNLVEKKVHAVVSCDPPDKLVVWGTSSLLNRLTGLVPKESNVWWSAGVENAVAYTNCKSRPDRNISYFTTFGSPEALQLDVGTAPLYHRLPDLRLNVPLGPVE
jgi:hypothetical protein